MTKFGSFSATCFFAIEVLCDCSLVSRVVESNLVSPCSSCEAVFGEWWQVEAASWELVLGLAVSDMQVRCDGNADVSIAPSGLARVEMLAEEEVVMMMMVRSKGKSGQQVSHGILWLILQKFMLRASEDATRSPDKFSSPPKIGR